MGIIAKTVPDHIRIQFGTGQPHHAEANPPVGLGELAGAHFVQIEYLIDEATGAVVGQTNNPLNGQAQVLPLDKVQELLGRTFVDLENQVRTLTAAMTAEQARTVAANKSANDALAALRTEAQSAIDALTAERDGLKSERDGLLERSRSAVEALGFKLTQAG